MKLKPFARFHFLYSIPFHLYFFLKKKKKTTHAKLDLRKPDAGGTDWPQQFLPVLPKTDGGVEAKEPRRFWKGGRWGDAKRGQG